MPTRLNPEPTRKLIAALRSGEHKQVNGQLEHIDGRRCCLGVACRVAIADGVPITLDRDHKHVSFDESEDLLPPAVQRWLTEEHLENPLLLVAPHHQTNETGEVEEATSLNDDFKFSFFQIADCFEYTLNRQEAAERA